MEFKYEALDANGAAQAGVVNAVNQDMAIEAVQRRGYTITNITATGPKTSFLGSITFFGGVSNKAELSVFLDRFESWPFASSKKNEIEQFKITFKDQSKNKNKDKKVVLEREKKKLADAGISGSAVVPKFSTNMESAVMMELIQEFKKTLL